MSSGLVFRKDCADCGRSFFTPDPKTNSCPRCTGKGQKRDQRVRATSEKGRAETLAAPKFSIKARSPLTPTNDLEAPGTTEDEPHGEGSEFPGVRVHEEGERLEVSTVPLAQPLGKPKREVVPTKDQEQEIIKRYQAYVEGMERPLKGRRKTIAAEMEIPYRAVVLAIRRWNQEQSREKDLSREERFLVEKSYFRLLERETTLLRVKEQIVQETGLCQWQVSRCLDLLHGGDDRLQGVPDVSPEQRTAILGEYHVYLSAPAPPSPPLHALIAERTGVTPKQIHKALLGYRFRLFQEKLSSCLEI
jgi:hypothetical protein